MKLPPNDNYWFSRARDFEGYAIGSGDCELAIVHNLAHDQEGEEDCKNRASVITEALNIATETSMTPRQLADWWMLATERGYQLEKQRAELLAAMKYVSEVADVSFAEAIDELRKAIAKAEGQK